MNSAYKKMIEKEKRQDKLAKAGSVLLLATLAVIINGGWYIGLVMRYG